MKKRALAAAVVTVSALGFAMGGLDAAHALCAAYQPSSDLGAEACVVEQRAWYDGDEYILAGVTGHGPIYKFVGVGERNWDDGPNERDWGVYGYVASVEQWEERDANGDQWSYTGVNAREAEYLQWNGPEGCGYQLRVASEVMRADCPAGTELPYVGLPRI